MLNQAGVEPEPIRPFLSLEAAAAPSWLLALPTEHGSSSDSESNNKCISLKVLVDLYSPSQLEEGFSPGPVVQHANILNPIICPGSN